MVRKLFIYTGIVIWHFEKAGNHIKKQNRKLFIYKHIWHKLKKKRGEKTKNPEISIFVTIFVEKCYFGLYFTAEMEFGKELITTLKILLITIL